MLARINVRQLLLLTLLLLFAYLLRVAGVWNLFPSADEGSHIGRAMVMAGGDLNPQWFLYPSGFFYTLTAFLGSRFAFGAFAGQFSAPTQFVHYYVESPEELTVYLRFVVAILATFSVLATYYAAKELIGRRWAWVAALFMAMAPMAVERSRELMPESMITLPAALTVYFAARYSKSGLWRDALLSALMAGMTTSVKYNGVFLVLLLPAAAWIYAREQEQPLLRFPIGQMIAAAIASLVGFALLTPYSILDTPTFSRDVFTLGGVTQYHVGFEGLYAAKQNAQFIWMFNATNELAPFLSVMLLGMLVLFILYRRWSSLLVVLPLLFLYVTVIYYDFAWPQHFLPGIPLMGLGLAMAVALLDEHWQTAQPYLAPLVALLVLLPSTLFAINHLYINLRSEPDTRMVSRDWIETNVPSGTKVLLDKLHTPYLVRSHEQVRFLLDKYQAENPADGRRLNIELEMNKPRAYWRERIPLILTARSPEHINEDGTIIQPNLLTPAEYEADGFEYAVLSSYMYDRFQTDPRYANLKMYYESFAEQGELVYEITPSVTRTGPTIRIYQLRP